MRCLKVVVAGMLALCCCITTADAQTDHSYPILLSVHPPAIQVGKTADVSITSFYLQRGAYQVLFAESGLRAEPLPEPPLKPGEKLSTNRRGKFHRAYRFKAAADALPGIRDYRIATDQGMSTVGQVVVTRDPVVLENEKTANDSLDTAQPITWPATVCGTLERGEDVDYYRFQVSAGQRLVFFVRGAALQNKLQEFEGFLDPQLTLFDASGKSLATANNSVGGDPLLAHTFRDAGEYRLEVRDVRFKGNPEWVYTLEIHDRPFVTQVFPPAVEAGRKSTLTPIGHNFSASSRLEITVPEHMEPGIHLISGTVDGIATNEFPVLVAPRAAAAVQEGTTRQEISRKGQPVAVPALVCGRIGTPGIIDRYTFNARRGERISFEVFARRCRSRLDSVLHILDEKGTLLAENDDQASLNLRASDSRIENWSAPGDGRYTLEIRDLNGSGGPEFVYALDISPSRPSFRLELESDKSHLSPGLSYPIYIHADRRAGFNGSIRLSASNMQTGVTAEAGIIPAGATHGCIILTAASDAPRGTGTVRVTGTAIMDADNGTTVEPRPLTVTAMTLADIRSADRALFFPVSSHVVSVGPPQNLRSVKVSRRELRLQPGESGSVEITIERVPQFQGLVRLDAYVLYLEKLQATSLPPGVTLDLEKSKAILNVGETHGTLVFHADKQAKPTERHLVPVMAQVAMGLVNRFNYCQPLWVSVMKP